jgi:glycosyltransferase involved in cell wall biosynthesis
MSVRILHVLPHRGGGAETYIDMLERLSGFAHERIYLSGGRTPANALVSVPARWPKVAARARRSDLVHAHGDVASVIALPLIRTEPAVMTTQGLHLLRRLHGGKRRLMVRAVASVASACDAVVCSSLDEHNDLVSVIRPADRKKLHVILNGIDPPGIIGEPARLAIRDELGIRPDCVLGLFVGQLEPRKAPLLAARAAVQARAAGAPFVLAVAGDGNEAPQLRALASDAVRVLGYRSDVGRLLSAADVYIHPSEREGMSFALLEAMIHGLSIVAADSSSNPEAIADAGLMFPAGDEDALIRALVRLSSEPELRASLGEKARVRARERFTPEGFLSQTKAVYLQVMSRFTEPVPAGGGPAA